MFADQLTLKSTVLGWVSGATVYAVAAEPGWWLTLLVTLGPPVIGGAISLTRDARRKAAERRAAELLDKLVVARTDARHARAELERLRTKECDG